MSGILVVLEHFGKKLKEGGRYIEGERDSVRGDHPSRGFLTSFLYHHGRFQPIYFESLTILIFLEALRQIKPENQNFTTSNTGEIDRWIHKFCLYFLLDMVLLCVLMFQQFSGL